MRWTQTIYRKKFSFQNPVHQNFKHAQVVQELLNIGPHQVHNVVVFVGSAVPKTPMPPNVIWGAQHLIEYINSKRIVMIEESNLDSYAQSLLDIQLPPGFRTRRAHIRRRTCRKVEFKDWRSISILLKISQMPRNKTPHMNISPMSRAVHFCKIDIRMDDRPCPCGRN